MPVPVYVPAGTAGKPPVISNAGVFIQTSGIGLKEAIGKALTVTFPVFASLQPFTSV